VVFTIVQNGFELPNPFEEIKVRVMQNNRWDNATGNLKPRFVRDNALVYDYNSEILFPAGKEFRWFDLRNLRLQSSRVKAIRTHNDTTYVFITEDRPRSFTKYLYEKDLNGAYIIDADFTNDSSLEADYAMVIFTLPFKTPLRDGELYLFGAFTDWQLIPDYALKYNFDRQAYEGKIYLKQGYYNYVYVFSPDKDIRDADMELIEGNYFETENSYTILVYYRPFGSVYDQLIGINTVNSLHVTDD